MMNPVHGWVWRGENQACRLGLGQVGGEQTKKGDGVPDVFDYRKGYDRVEAFGRLRQGGKEPVLWKPRACSLQGFGINVDTKVAVGCDPGGQGAGAAAEIEHPALQIGPCGSDAPVSQEGR